MATENNFFTKSRFTFIGEISYSKKDGGTPLVKGAIKEGSPWSKKALKIGIVDDDKNVGYPFMEYLYKTKDATVKLFDSENKGHDVLIKDLANQSSIDLVPEMSRIILDFEEDFELKKEYTKDIYASREIRNKEVITDEDKEKLENHQKNLKEKAKNRFEVAHMDTAIDILNKKLPELEGKRVKISGTVNLNYYNENTRLEYVPNRIEMAQPNEKSNLTITSKVFYDENSLTDDEENKRIVINAYFGQKYKKQEKLYPIQLILDYNKLDLENDTHKAMLSFLKSHFDCEDCEAIYNNKFLLKVINGREKVEFSEECLTEQQKQAIAFGLNTLDDFRPRGGVYGERIQEIRIIKPSLTDEYKDGGLIAFSIEELISHLITSEDDTSDIKKDEVKKEEDNTQSQQNDFMGLFG